MRGLLGITNDKPQYEQNRSALRSFADMQAGNDFRRSGPTADVGVPPADATKAENALVISRSDQLI